MTDERIIAYLLQELPEDERERFEDECFFEQPGWPVELNLVEEDLIDTYLRNDLTPERRERFEKNYLTTDARLAQVATAAALLRHADELGAVSKASISDKLMQPTWAKRVRSLWSAQTPTVRALAAILPIVIIAATLALMVPYKPAGHNIVGVSVIFSNGSRAGGTEVQRVSLPRSVDALKVFMPLPRQLGPASNYRVELENDDGEATQLEVAIQDVQTIVGIIPVARLAGGSYVLKLFTRQSDGTEQRVPGGYFLSIE